MSGDQANGGDCFGHRAAAGPPSVRHRRTVRCRQSVTPRGESGGRSYGGSRSTAVPRPIITRVQPLYWRLPVPSRPSDAAQSWAGGRCRIAWSWGGGPTGSCIADVRAPVSPLRSSARSSGARTIPSRRRGLVGDRRVIRPFPGTDGRVVIRGRRRPAARVCERRTAGCADPPRDTDPPVGTTAPRRPRGRVVPGTGRSGGRVAGRCRRLLCLPASASPPRS